MHTEALLDMLDWNQPEEIQKSACKAAAGEDIKIFLQPCTKRHNKNVWDNCARILSQKTDDQLSPYLQELFCWIKDMNWPGAFEIRDRLKKYSGKNELRQAYEEAIQKARATKDRAWLDNLLQFMD